MLDYKLGQKPPDARGFLSVVEPAQKPTSRSLLHFQKWGNNSLHFGADLDRGGKWAALADVRTLWTLLYVVLHIWCPLANMSKTWKFAVLTEKRQKSCLSLVQLFNYSAVIPSGIFSLLSQHLKLKHVCAGSWGKQKQTHISMLCIEPKWKWTEAHDDGEVSEDEWRWGFDSLCYVSVYC